MIELRNVGVVLELMKASFHHVLRVDFLHSQQIEHHVIGEVKGRIDGVGGPLDQIAADGGGHFVVDHEDDDALAVDAAATGATGHLNVFAASDLKESNFI